MRRKVGVAWNGRQGGAGGTFLRVRRQHLSNCTSFADILAHPLSFSDRLLPSLTLTHTHAFTHAHGYKRTHTLNPSSPSTLTRARIYICTHMHTHLHTQGVVERGELVALCKTVMARFPPAIQPVPNQEGAAHQPVPHQAAGTGAPAGIPEPPQATELQPPQTSMLRGPWAGTTQTPRSSAPQQQAGGAADGPVGSGRHGDSSAAHAQPEQLQQPQQQQSQAAQDSGVSGALLEEADAPGGTQQQEEAARLKGNQAFGRREYAKVGGVG